MGNRISGVAAVGSLLLMGAACARTAAADFPGEVLIGTSPAPGDPAHLRMSRSDFAQSMAAITEWPHAPAATLHLAASFISAVHSSQVAFHIFDVSELADESQTDSPGEPVMSDVVDVAPGASAYVGECPASWLKPCRRYQFAFYSDRQRLAVGFLKTKPCGRAIDELRGGIISYLRSANEPFTPPPKLYQFTQSLSDYTRLIGGGVEQRVVTDGRVRFGIRAALQKPLGAAQATLVIADDSNAGLIVARLPIAADPTWDTIASEWVLAPAGGWLISGHRYRLSLMRTTDQAASNSRQPLAVGRFRYFHREP